MEKGKLTTLTSVAHSTWCAYHEGKLGAGTTVAWSDLSPSLKRNREQEVLNWVNWIAEQRATGTAQVYTSHVPPLVELSLEKLLDSGVEPKEVLALRPAYVMMIQATLAANYELEWISWRERNQVKDLTCRTH